jgi:hypothetical protein
MNVLEFANPYKSKGYFLMNNQREQELLQMLTKEREYINDLENIIYWDFIRTNDRILDKGQKFINNLSSGKKQYLKSLKYKAIENSQERQKIDFNCGSY